MRLLVHEQSGGRVRPLVRDASETAVTPRMLTGLLVTVYGVEARQYICHAA